MVEYINKQELLQDIHDAVRFTVARSGKGQTSLELKGANKVLDRIKSAPTADVVEVVRCKKCEHYNTNCCADGFGWCEKHNRGEMDEHYCNYGERRSEDD